MKKEIKRLVLSKETVRNLNDSVLARVPGGDPVDTADGGSFCMHCASNTPSCVCPDNTVITASGNTGC